MKQWARLEYESTAAAMAWRYRGDKDMEQLFVRALQAAARSRVPVADQLRSAVQAQAFPDLQPSKFRGQLAELSVGFAKEVRTLAIEAGVDVGDESDLNNKWAIENLANAFMAQFKSNLALDTSDGLDASIREHVLEELGLSGAEKRRLILRTLTIAASAPAGAIISRGLVHHQGEVTAASSVGSVLVVAAGTWIASKCVDDRSNRIKFCQVLAELARRLAAPFYSPSGYQTREYERDPGRLADWLDDICRGIPPQFGIGTVDVAIGPPRPAPGALGVLDVAYTFDQMAQLEDAFLAFDRFADELGIERWDDITYLRQAVEGILDLEEKYRRGEAVDLRKRHASGHDLAKALTSCSKLARVMAKHPESETLPDRPTPETPTVSVVRPPDPPVRAVA